MAMMGEWRNERFGQMAELVQDTVHPSDVIGIPYIGLEHIGEGTLQLLGAGLAEDATSIKSQFKAGDILFGKLRPYFRKVIRAPFDGICSTDIWVVRPKAGVDSGFLFYLMASDIFIEPLVRASEGTKMPRAKWDFAISLEFPLPPLPEQQAIARILGTLNDKIELNRSMNETLEAMARSIFKSWFVDFDPVQAKAEGREPAGMDAETAALFPDDFDETEMGMVPKGWKVGKLGEYLLNFDSKRVPVSGAERCKRKGPYPYHGAAGIMDYIDDYLFDGMYVLVGEDGSVIQEDGFAVIQYVWGRFWVNNHAHVLQGKGAISSEQLYLYFQFETVAPYVTGAVQPKLSQGRMNGMPFLFAGDAVCRAFAQLVLPFFALLRTNVDCNNTLISMRDALLPMLISGELRVKNAKNSLSEHILSDTSDITGRNKEALYVTQKNVH